MHIAIAGNIGSGKTTLTGLLAKHYGWKAKYEVVDNNPYLEDFYSDMSRWAFNLEVFFLNSRFKQVQEFRNEGGAIIQDRTIYEGSEIFAKNLYTTGNISERDYGTYRTLFDSMVDRVTPPDLLIYLRASLPTLVQQVQQRGRSYENAIPIDYLQQLNTHYEEWISEYKHGGLLIIDADDNDFLENPEDLGGVIDKIDAQINGLF